jgi:hypothetical protein
VTITIKYCQVYPTPIKDQGKVGKGLRQLIGNGFEKLGSIAQIIINESHQKQK